MNVLTQNEIPKKVCHNEPIAENFMGNNGGPNKLQLIDWQCSGISDPHWEVAVFSVQNHFNLAARKSFLEAYFGIEDRRLMVLIVLF
jgi:thiamine kinase-like enzyme